MIVIYFSAVRILFLGVQFIMTNRAHFSKAASVFLQAIDCWEWVTNLILRRETVLEKLEKFERKASDPNRFFERGELNYLDFAVHSNWLGFEHRKKINEWYSLRFDLFYFH